ncbi:hypothetical protein [Micromonospora sp. NPDC050695]|uniref:hypothetical protein n=1 Tax=Micromonospora sp. NPDC050695 TaxID=3154938 RepID=UPI0033DCFDE9
MTRRLVRRFAAASTAALVAAVAFVLTTAALADLQWDPQLAVVTALGAVFVPQSLVLSMLLPARRPAGGGVR